MIVKLLVAIVLFEFLVSWSSTVECTQLYDNINKVFCRNKRNRLSIEDTLNICEQSRDLPAEDHEISSKEVMIELVRLCSGRMELCEDLNAFKRIKRKFSREASPALDCLRHCEERMEELCSEDFQRKTDIAINSLQAKPDEYLQVVAFKDIMFEFGESPKIQKIVVGTARFLMKLRNFAPMSADRNVFFDEFELYVAPVCNNIISVLTDHEEFKAKKPYLVIPAASFWYKMRDICLSLLNNQNSILVRVHNYAPKVKRF